VSVGLDDPAVKFIYLSYPMKHGMIAVKIGWMLVSAAWCAGGRGSSGAEMRQVCQAIRDGRDMGAINEYIREIPEGSYSLDGNEAAEFVERIGGCLGGLDGGNLAKVLSIAESSGCDAGAIKGFIQEWTCACRAKFQCLNAEDLAGALSALSRWTRKKDYEHYRGTVEPCVQEWVGFVNGSKTVEEFNSIDFSTVMASLSRFLSYSGCGIESGPIRGFLSKWIRKASTKIGDFSPQELSSSILSFNEIPSRYRGGLEVEFASKWMGCALGRLEGFDGHELSNSIWALAEMGAVGEETKEFASRWIGCALRKLKRFDEQDLSSSIWALAEMGVAGKEAKEFAGRWIGCALRKLKRFDEQKLSNSIFGLAIIGVAGKEAKEFASKWMGCALGRLEEFDGHELSNSIWALAEMGVAEEETKEFVGKWIGCALEKLEEFNGQELFNSIWALAEMGAVGEEEEARKFPSKWMECALGKLEEFSEQELSDSILALTTIGAVGEEAKEFVGKWMECALGKLEGFDEQELSDSIFGLATIGAVGKEAKEFASKWMECALRKLEGFDGHKLSSSIWALAEMGAVGEETKEFASKWMECALGKLEEFDEQGLSNSIWALKKMGVAEKFMSRMADMGMADEVFEKVRAYKERFRSEEDLDVYERLKAAIKMLSGYAYVDFKNRARKEMEELEVGVEAGTTSEEEYRQRCDELRKAYDEMVGLRDE
jgi:phage-related protein